MLAQVMIKVNRTVQPVYSADNAVFRQLVQVTVNRCQTERGHSLAGKRVNFIRRRMNNVFP